MSAAVAGALPLLIRLRAACQIQPARPCIAAAKGLGSVPCWAPLEAVAFGCANAQRKGVVWGVTSLGSRPSTCMRITQGHRVEVWACAAIWSRRTRIEATIVVARMRAARRCLVIEPWVGPCTFEERVRW